MEIAVLGGGVNGFGCAIKIKEAFPNFQVTVFTKDITPNTTGDGSAGLWGPYVMGDTPDHKVVQWSGETHDFFHELWLQGEAGSCLLPCLAFSDTEDKMEAPAWKHIPYGYKNLSDEELRRYNEHMGKNYKCGTHYTTYTCEPGLLLPYLMDRFNKAGGNVHKKEISSLNTFAEGGYDAIINCTGLGSRYIVPDDKVFPTRGQVVRVNAPWQNEVIFADNNYIIPNIKGVVLGGTKQKNDYNINISPEDSKNILEGCRNTIPGLKGAGILFEWAGLRPSREITTRLERSDIKTKGNKNVIVIHNYGHGGSGVTLFWGCATEVVDIIRQALKEKAMSKL